MWSLAWANLTHHRGRTAISVLAVSLGIALLLVSKGLARGSIREVADRMESVDAELIVLPAQENVIFTGGAVFPGAFERLLARTGDDRGPIATNVIPVFWGQVRMAGQQQRIFGIDPGQFTLFLGPRRLLAGKAFDRAVLFAERDRTREEEHPSAEESPDLSDGLELIIDDRLARAGGYRLGDDVRVMGQLFRITGIVEDGVAGRVFAPIQTLREMLNGGEPWSSMYFVRLRDDKDPTAAAEQFAAALGPDAQIRRKDDFGHRLRRDFRQVELYMNASSGLALVVCFLFILLTMYTMVLERTREIGVLRALGLTRAALLRLSILEALLVSASGVIVGTALAFAAKAALHMLLPLLTVALAAELLVLAALIGVVGGVLSALYPGLRAARLDPAVALNYE